MTARALLLSAVLLPTALTLKLPHGVGKLPALGWNSWNAYYCDSSETKLLQAAQYMVDLGFKAAGYEYVNQDDCWSIKTGRDNVTHRIIPDPVKFPNGINHTAKAIHDLGLKFGIYSDAGTETCGGYPGSLGYEQIDAETFAGWGVDYLKYDNCYVPANWTDECNFCVPDASNSDLTNGTCSPSSVCPSGYDYSTSNTAIRYHFMRDALVSVQKINTILFSLCDWGQASVWSSWGPSTGSSWRTTGDITPDWGRVAALINENSFLGNFAHFWGHNDADMLEIGNGNLTYAESRSHFAIWAAMKSPLIIGTNLEYLSQDLIDIMLNKRILAFHQDNQHGAPAKPYRWGTNPDWTFNATNPAEYWSGQSKQGTMVFMLNTLNETRTMEAYFAEVPGLNTRKTYNVIDVWTGDSLGCLRGGVTQQVDAHDTAVLLIQEAYCTPARVGGGSRR